MTYPVDPYEPQPEQLHTHIWYPLSYRSRWMKCGVCGLVTGSEFEEDDR